MSKKEKKNKVTVDLGVVQPIINNSLGNPVMNNVFEFKMNFLPRTLWIAVGADPDDLNRLFPEGDTNDKPFVDMEPENDGIVDVVRILDPEPHGGVLIRYRTPDEINFDTASHECFHTLLEFLRYINSSETISITSENEEIYCYLLGYLARCCEYVKNQLSK